MTQTSEHFAYSALLNSQNNAISTIVQHNENKQYSKNMQLVLLHMEKKKRKPFNEPVRCQALKSQAEKINQTGKELSSSS